MRKEEKITSILFICGREGNPMIDESAAVGQKKEEGVSAFFLIEAGGRGKGGGLPRGHGRDKGRKKKKGGGIFFPLAPRGGEGEVKSPHLTPQCRGGGGGGGLDRTRLFIFFEGEAQIFPAHSWGRKRRLAVGYPDPRIPKESKRRTWFS